MASSRIGGTLIPPGSYSRTQMGGKVYIPAASYPSSSDRNKNYTVCEVSDGSISCDCMGWTRRNPPGGRTCKHTQDYEMFLRADWNPMNNGQLVPSAVEMGPRPTPAGNREKGGSLTDLFKKLDEGGLKC